MINKHAFGYARKVGFDGYERIQLKVNFTSHTCMIQQLCTCINPIHLWKKIVTLKRLKIRKNMVVGVYIILH